MSAWLVLLCGYLAVWVPFNAVLLVNRSLPSIGNRGAVAIAELALHVAGAVLCVAAGWMLWGRHETGVRFAGPALVVSALLTIQALYVSALPRDVRPGLALPLALLTIAHATAWILFLRKSRRLRAWMAVSDQAGVSTTSTSFPIT